MKRIKKNKISSQFTKIFSSISVTLRRLKNKGKDIAEVRKNCRTLKTFTSRAQIAFCLAQPFGLEVRSVVTRIL